MNTGCKALRGQCGTESVKVLVGQRMRLNIVHSGLSVFWIPMMGDEE